MLIIALLTSFAIFLLIEEIFNSTRKAILFIVLSIIDILSWWEVNKPIGIVCLIVFGLCTLVIISVYILTYTGKNDPKIDNIK